MLTEQIAGTDLTGGIAFAGPLDRLSDPVSDDVVAVLREALSNTVRHAHPGTVDITITPADPVLTVKVTDNGGGIGHPTRSGGPANPRRRAETHGGTLHHDTPPGGGGHLT